MFLYRVKVEELDERSRSSLKTGLSRGEKSLRAHCPIREMSVVAEDQTPQSGLDIYLALDDFIDGVQLRRLFAELRSMIRMDLPPGQTTEPQVSTELIHI